MKNLISILKSDLNANYAPISAIDCTCCNNSMFEVIDFDDVKRNYCRILNIKDELKSTDCLHIDEVKGILCFIEMKNVSEFIIHNKGNYTDFNLFSEHFEKWINKLLYDLRSKLIESLFIVTSISAKFDTTNNDVATIIDNKKTRIKYLVLAGMTNSEYLTYSISTLEKKIPYGMLEGRKAVTILADDFDTYAAEYL